MKKEKGIEKGKGIEKEKEKGIKKGKGTWRS